MEEYLKGEQYKTLVDLCYHWEKASANQVFLRQPKGAIWTEYTWGETMEYARKLVTAFQDAGLQKGDKIGILSKNCAHWVISEIAIMIGGYIHVPFYATTNEKSLKELVDLSQVKLLFVGKLDEWDTVKGTVPEKEDLKIVQFPYYEGNAVVQEGISWDNFIGNKLPSQENYTPALTDIWSIFYTSGTTGTPKGVVHTYASAANILYDQEMQHGDFHLYNGQENVFFSYLPLNHIAEQVLIVTGCIYASGYISFAESIDTFQKNLVDTSPSVFLAVPRIWTKFQQGVLAKMPQKKLDLFLKIPVLSGIVKKKIKAALGLQRIKLCISGAAPMPKPLLRWYQKLGIIIQETYGLTETMGVVIINPLDDLQIDKSGKKLREAQIKIDPETEEILVKTSWLFKEYYQAEELNKEVFETDGFFHTGDTGELDSQGFLKVTGRVKDTFKTSKGKFIVPALIEDNFASNTLIEQICIVGLGLPQPIALLVLSENCESMAESDIHASLQQTLKEVNAKLASHEKVKKIICVKDPWSVENGLMTPTLKIKRNVIHKLNAEKYQDWYHCDEIIVSEA